MIPFCEMNYFENFGFSEYLVVFYTFSANGWNPVYFNRIIYYCILKKCIKKSC